MGQFLLNSDTQETCPCFSLIRYGQSIQFWPWHMEETQSLSLMFYSVVDIQSKGEIFHMFIKDQKWLQSREPET